MDTFEKLDERSQRSLEWQRLLNYVSDHALSSVAKQFSMQLPFFDDLETVEEKICETEEFVSLVKNGSDLLLDTVPDVNDILYRLSAGSRLNTEELLSIKDVLSVTKRVNSSIRLLTVNDFPKLTPYKEGLFNLDSLRRELEKSIDEKGAIKDDASVELRNIRRNIRKLHTSIKDELGKLMHTSTITKALQESLITQRNGRYVLPVSANKRGIVKGIVHDTSQSGLTVYIEPISIVEPSNKIRILETDEEREIEKIIENLCAICREEIASIQSSFDTLITLDVIQAKAKIAIKYDGIKPELSDDGSIILVESRHPLLVLQDEKEVVANSLTMGGGERTLVITGPNTGGKTVFLKQVGLMSLMVKSGLLLPAKSGTKIPVFSRIWADIGDEQSLEQSLSTFSSHLQNIVSIVNGSKSGILILLDEIGVGTDPKEGAAIAHAVLEHLNQSGAITVTTTHYTDLKLLAYSETGFVNASLEFNKATFAPTYKLRLGVPGSSKGIEIARQLGLNSAITERAINLISEQEDDKNRLMTELEAKLASALKKEAELSDRTAELKSKAESFEREKGKFHSQRLTLEQEYADQLKDQFSETEARIKDLVKELQQKPNLRKAEEIRKRLVEIKKEVDWLEPEPVKSGGELTNRELPIGARVKVKSLNQSGAVEEVQEAPGEEGSWNVVVRLGTMKVKVSARDLILLETVGSSRKQAVKRTKRGRGRATKTEQSASPTELREFIRTDGNTIDLRGKRVDEALDLTESFLDQCLIGAINPIMIIHGHGTGAVKKAVRDYLKRSKYSKSFRPGEMYEGGDGVTVVDLA